VSLKTFFLYLASKAIREGPSDENRSYELINNANVELVFLHPNASSKKKETILACPNVISTILTKDAPMGPSV
jgi:hypothetical protein